MKEKSIELLNKALQDELLAVHQYMYFHFHCDDQGYDPLSALFRQTAIQEMMHVERLAERILFLKGEVQMAVGGTTEKIHNVREMLAKAMQMEEESARSYNLWANECAAHADAATKKLFEALVEEEEVHFNQYETQEGHIKQFGEQFLALQSIERSKKITTPAASAEKAGA
jgi:bacterioferritin